MYTQLVLFVVLGCCNLQDAEAASEDELTEQLLLRKVARYVVLTCLAVAPCRMQRLLARIACSTL
jgi:hypothetical protein